MGGDAEQSLTALCSDTRPLVEDLPRAQGISQRTSWCLLQTLSKSTTSFIFR